MPPCLASMGFLQLVVICIKGAFAYIFTSSPCDTLRHRDYCSHFSDKENELQKDRASSVLKRRSRIEPKWVDCIHIFAAMPRSVASWWETRPQKWNQKSTQVVNEKVLSLRLLMKAVTLTEGTGLEKKEGCWLFLFLWREKSLPFRGKTIRHLEQHPSD